MRVADPVPNVGLRTDTHGHHLVVLSFPYRADVVDAVRQIPGRRFDWDAREWSAPQSDVTAPYVKGILERYPDLLPSEDVMAWLGQAVHGWVGRISAGRHDGRGWYVLDAIAGDLPPELEALGEAEGRRRRLPLTSEVAQVLQELRGGRMDDRALRCSQELLVGRAPAPATLALIDGVADRRFTLKVNWDPDALAAFVELPAIEAHGPSLPLDASLLEPLEHFLLRFGIDVAPAARVALADLRDEHEQAVVAIRRSRAASGPALDVEPRLGGELAPFQRAGVAYVLQARRAFLADEQGLGKTVQALAALEADDAYPAVVVCPASLKLNWEREARHWLAHRTVTVVSGGHTTPPGADITVINYDIVHKHKARLLAKRPQALVLDESHYVKNPRAQRTRAIRSLAQAMPGGALRLALTGTPVMNHPEELVSQLRVLGRLDEFGSGARFARRFQGAGAEERIHWHLRRSCFVRRLKRDVLPQLPAKRQVVVPVSLDNRRDYKLAEEDVIAWLREQPLDLGELEAKVAAALRAERLAQLNALRRLAAQGKVGAALSWIEDFLASDEPLVVFSGHRDVQRRLVERFPDALHLVGSDSVATREAAVRAFQEEDGPQLIVCSTRVGGQGITLTRASNVAFLDLEWTPAVHDQAEDRCHRIGQHDAVTAWYLLAPDTIDEPMVDLMERKRGIVEAVTDGTRRDTEGLVEAVIKELRGSRPRRRLRSVA